ncbi:restriction endonuclease subunit S [Mycoplasmopsis arginini]|uniref:Type I restriction modification DNA specificity domain-containing protein n=1 Tax=Mycoplasmopsis arginini TaxID=2094 RepID=A0AA43U041_MYCAR|nr:restriction endonuclease subunit S [Mycoplasmopsis arginini]MDI3349671.1 hypothetical protein [Mycoplasmopsis arginini]
MRTFKIKEISEIINGATPSTSNPLYWDGSIPWITPKDLTDFHNRYINSGHSFITEEGYKSCSTKMLPIGTILLSSRAPIGYLAIANKEMCTNQGFKSIICNSQYINNLYMFYWLSTKINYLQQISSGATFKELSKDNLENVEINLPTLAEQQHIVNTIGTIDDLIEKKQIEYNKKLKYLLFLLDKSESDKTNTFGYVFKSFNGGTFESKYYVTNSNKKLITIKNIDDSGFNTNNVSQLSEEKADNKYLLSIGDIVLTMTGNIGRSGIVDENNCYLNQRVLKITSDSSSYLFAYLHKYKKEIIQLGKGTAQLNLSLDDLKELKVFNSYNEITSFKKYDCLYSSLLNCKLVIKKAKQIKQLLLSKYF